jgi:hypothetical protein
VIGCVFPARSSILLGDKGASRPDHERLHDMFLSEREIRDKRVNFNETMKMNLNLLTFSLLRIFK